MMWSAVILSVALFAPAAGEPASASLRGGRSLSDVVQNATSSRSAASSNNVPAGNSPEGRSPVPAPGGVVLHIEDLHVQPILTKALEQFPAGTLITEVEWDADAPEYVEVDVLLPDGVEDETWVPVTSEILNHQLPLQLPVAPAAAAAPGQGPAPAVPPPPAVAKPGIHDLSLEPVLATMREKFPGAVVTELVLETDDQDHMLHSVDVDLLTPDGFTWEVVFSPSGEIQNMTLDDDSVQPGNSSVQLGSSHWGHHGHHGHWGHHGHHGHYGHHGHHGHYGHHGHHGHYGHHGHHGHYR